MRTIDLTKENLDIEHICCVISEKKEDNGIELKKNG